MSPTSGSGRRRRRNIGAGQASFIGVDVDHAGAVRRPRRAPRSATAPSGCGPCARSPASTRPTGGRSTSAPRPSAPEKSSARTLSPRASGSVRRLLSSPSCRSCSWPAELNFRGAERRWPSSELGPVPRAMLERAAETHFFRRSAGACTDHSPRPGRVRPGAQAQDAPRRDRADARRDRRNATASGTPMRHSGPHKGHPRRSLSPVFF